MHSIEFVRVPQTPAAIATILAALILADLQSGQARALPDSVAYGPAADVIASPDETIARGLGSSADLTRIAGATQGDAVACIGDPVSGFRCVLMAAGRVIDPAKGRGAPPLADAAFAGAATAPITRPTAPPKSIAVGEPTPGLPSFQPLLSAARDELPAGDHAQLQEVARLLSSKPFPELIASAENGGTGAVLLAAASAHAVRADADTAQAVLTNGTGLQRAALCLAQLALNEEPPPEASAPCMTWGPRPHWGPRPSYVTFRQRGLAPPGCGGSCGTRY